MEVMTYQVPEIDQKIFDEAGFRPDDLDAQARATSANWNITRRPRGPLPFTDRVEQARVALDTLQAELHHLATGAPAPLHELRENPRLLQSALKEISDARKSIPLLPRIADEPRASVLARAYLKAAGDIWNGS